MQLGHYKIGLKHAPFIIAEVSANHDQNLERVFKMIEGAHAAGVQCIKLQTWSEGGMTLDVDNNAFKIDDPASLWYGYSLFDLYKVARLPWDWHKPIFDKCRELGLLAISTPFDLPSVDFLETFDVPFYKIASFENVDLPLIAKVAKTGKPMIISTGLANVKEIVEAVECARDNGAKDIVLLKCTSQYPADPKNSNLMTIPHMRQLFNCEVGFSDHTQGLGAAVASVVYGACVIEKHFTLSEDDQTLDAAFSLDILEMKRLVEECKNAWHAKGEVFYGKMPGEEASLKYRRSLYIAEDIKKGEILTDKNMRVVRPGYGLAPKHFNSLLGRKVTKNIQKGTALTWEHVSESVQSPEAMLEACE